MLLLFLLLLLFRLLLLTSAGGSLRCEHKSGGRHRALNHSARGDAPQAADGSMFSVDGAGRHRTASESRRHRDARRQLGELVGLVLVRRDTG